MNRSTAPCQGVPGLSGEAGLFLSRNPFGRAGILIRAAIPDHTNSLYFDFDAGACEVGNRDEGAPGIVPVVEIVIAHFYKAVSIPRLLDEHRHAHYVGETAARTLEDRIDVAEHLAYLRVEITGNILLVLVARCGLS